MNAASSDVLFFALALGLRHALEADHVQGMPQVERSVAIDVPRSRA